MNVLIVGGGGREHALAWKIAQSPHADRVFVAPGNAGTAEDAENVDIPVNDFSKLISFARDNRVELTVVGPEAPLCAGIVDAFEVAKLRAFGPSKAAAQLEGSKAFCKDILHGGDVPTADYHVFEDAKRGQHFIEDRYPTDTESCPVVVKADGLAAGKGAIVCSKRQDALQAIDRIARGREFGSAGDRYIIEDRMHGQEASVLAITDGRTIVTLSPTQDHKPAYDGDTGPNTGGMGAYCPAPLIDASTLQWVEQHVLVPTVHAMKRNRHPFRGVLYAGLMVTHQGPKVLEYNVRFGDPECQPLLMRLKTDLVEILQAAIDGRLDELSGLEWDPRPAVCVVMASEGYPNAYETGKAIRGLEDAAKLPDVKVFHAGTRVAEDTVQTSGGRVLGVTALGDSISTAKRQAYVAVKCIRWEGAWCRKDISDQALNTSWA
ncbi:MAG: phosphoribosylamine--glycine ligase [Pirellulaceae bacterium]